MPGAPVMTSLPFQWSGSRITNCESLNQPLWPLVVEVSGKWPSIWMPGTAPAGLRVVRECSVPQSLAPVWLVRMRYGVERSSRHQLIWRSAPGTALTA